MLVAEVRCSYCYAPFGHYGYCPYINMGVAVPVPVVMPTTDELQWLKAQHILWEGDKRAS